MIFCYGYLPTVFPELKTLVLTEPMGGTPATLTLSTSAEAVSFLDAVALLNTQLNTQSGGDLTATFSTSTGRVTIASASSATWKITEWKARGFFGFDYPIDNSHGVGGVALGAQMLEGLEVKGIESITAAESRESYGDSYHHHKGTRINLEGFIRPEEMRQAHRSGQGIGSDLGWHNYKGRIRLVDLNGDASAWSLTNPTGYIDGRLISASVSGQISVLNAELWRVGLKVAL